MTLENLYDMLASLQVVEDELKEFPYKGQGPSIESKRIISLNYIQREIAKVKYQVVMDLTNRRGN